MASFGTGPTVVPLHSSLVNNCNAQQELCKLAALYQFSSLATTPTSLASWQSLMDTTSELAAQTHSLSAGLRALAETCGDESITKHISSIATEIQILGSNLGLLHEAMRANGAAYTVAFRQDLDEITNELQMIFEEVEECSVQLQKADPSSYNAVGWFFRKGRALRFQKHLEALKTTVVVMSTVLNHGKDYASQVSPQRLAESTPHTMSENRAILESVFLKNRDAIKDLDSMEQSRTHGHSSSTLSESAPDFNPGAHGRNLSNATGVETLSVPDVLPSIEVKQDFLPIKEGLARRFSKRVGLSVHKSIVEINANDAEVTLKKRWVKTDVSKPMPSIAEASSVASGQLLSAEKDGAVSELGPNSCPPKADENGRASFAFSIGKSPGLALRGMSLNNKQTSPRKDPAADGPTGGEEKAKGEKMVEKEGRGPIAYLKKKFSRPALTAEDHNREFESRV